MKSFSNGMDRNPIKQKSHKQMPRYEEFTYVPPIQIQNNRKIEHQQLSQNSSMMCQNQKGSSCLKYCFFMDGMSSKEKAGKTGDIQLVDGQIGLERQENWDLQKSSDFFTRNNKKSQKNRKNNETDRKFMNMNKMDNLSPKISLSKTSNLFQDNKEQNRKKTYTEHDNLNNFYPEAPNYYQCATDRTPNSSNQGRNQTERRIRDTTVQMFHPTTEPNRFHKKATPTKKIEEFGFSKKKSLQYNQSNFRPDSFHIKDNKQIKKSQLKMRKDALQQQIQGLDYEINRMESRYYTKISELELIKRQLIIQLHLMESPKAEGGKKSFHFK